MLHEMYLKSKKNSHEIPDSGSKMPPSKAKQPKTTQKEDSQNGNLSVVQAGSSNPHNSIKENNISVHHVCSDEKDKENLESTALMGASSCDNNLESTKDRSWLRVGPRN